VVRNIPAQALAAKPSQQDIQRLIALYTAGRLGKAEAKAFQLIEKFPQASVVYNLLGVVQAGLGKAEEAIANYVQAITIKPDFAEAHNNLGVTLKKCGLHEQAAESYRLATVADPDFAQAHNNLGNVLIELGRIEEAAVSHGRAVRLNPDSVYALSVFAKALQYVRSVDGLADFKDLIVLCLESSAIGSGEVRWASQTLLKSSLGKFRNTDAVAPHDLAILDPSTGGLLVTHLKHTLIVDTGLEIFLSGVRSKFLELWPKGGHEAPMKEMGLRLLEAFAYQGFLNEYVWHVTDDENSSLDALEEDISGVIRGGISPGEFDLYLLAAYRPLYEIECIRCWALKHHGDAGAGLKGFLKYVILDSEREQEIGQQMERLTSIDDDISIAVRSQYEENPYPRWDSLFIGKPRIYTEKILGAISPHRPALEPASQAPDILIAGCGTGKHPISSALGYLHSNVLAVDLSKTSLAFAKRKAEELKVPNIRFTQADILKLGELEGIFDIVECGGVLHHMADPEAGLTILLERLKPGGFLSLGLYSELARKNVVQLRQLVSEKAFEPTLQGIREFRLYVRESKNPDAAALQQVNDFYAASGVRDLIFHVQEHRFTIPLISKLLDDHKLEFLGFAIEDPLVKSGYLTQFPDDPDCLDLENWHQFERDNPRTFARMYQFWCRKGV
jgi:SAM-dependent methyltransferase